MALTSFYANLSEKLIARIKAQLPEIRHVDLDLGQLDFYDQKPAVAWPCVLFDFFDTEYLQRQDGQHGNMQVRFRLSFDVVSDTSGFSSTAVREKGLQYFELEKKLVEALQYWQADGLVFDDFRRTRSASEKRNDPFRTREIVFKASYFSC
jgi:hypothetical protein